MKFSRVVFCDFNERPCEDTFVSVLEKFIPDQSAKLLPLLFTRQITLKQGIRQTIGSIPSIHYSEIIKYIACRPICPGLSKFADFLKDLEIPLVVISGGLIDIVKAVLEGDIELVSKVKAMAQYPAELKIAIGDLVTDINMALAADLIFTRDCGCGASPKDSARAGGNAEFRSPGARRRFAPLKDVSACSTPARRHRLEAYLDAENKSYIKWQDFFDIRDRLAAR